LLRKRLRQDGEVIVQFTAMGPTSAVRNPSRRQGSEINRS